jgi:hypothetical protein
MVQDGESERVKFTYEQLRSGETMLTGQTGTGKYATQKGMSAMGSIRNTHLVDKQLGEMGHDMRGDAFLRAQTGDAKGDSQKGMRGIGSARNQVALVEFKKEWKTKEAKIASRKSEGINPKLSGDYDLATQSNAGISIGSRRNNTTGIISKFQPDQRCEGMTPFQSGTNRLASQKGMTCPPGTGAYRLQTNKTEYNMTEEQMRKSGELVPWYSGQSKFDSQKLTGGFGKVRDVCPHTKGTKTYSSDDKLQASHGEVRGQMGTNKLAAQHGMAMGGQRNQVNRSKLKQEWIDQLKEAEDQWAADHPRWAQEKEENAVKTGVPVVTEEVAEPEAEEEEAEKEEVEAEEASEVAEEEEAEEEEEEE